MSASEMAEQRQRKLTKLERAIKLWKKDNFVHNAIQIVNKAAELNYKSHGIYSDLLDKMLHSIFFLGNMHSAWFHPKEIFDESEIFMKILELFQGPIENYTTEVPARTPFSYFLELVVNISRNEGEVKTVLSDTLQKCKVSENQHTLISSVICICEGSGRSYYGGSLSCPGDSEREIMTAVSCLHVWHPYVSSAVLDVFPVDRIAPEFPHGNMTLPRSVECRAYAIENLGEVKAPCLRCNELYSLPNHSDSRNKPGNCAETEAISNLLTNDEVVRNGTRMNVRVLEKEYIRERMSHYFNTKMEERDRSKRGNYSINRIYKCECEQCEPLMRPMI